MLRCSISPNEGRAIVSHDFQWSDGTIISAECNQLAVYKMHIVCRWFSIIYVYMLQLFVNMSSLIKISFYKGT